MPWQPPLSNKPATGITLPIAWYAGHDAHLPVDGWFKLEAGSRAVLTILTSFASHVTVIRDLLGYSAPGDGGIRRALPSQHPVYNYLWASEISGIQWFKADGVDQPNGAPQAMWVLLTVVYTCPEYELKSDQDVGGDETQRYVTWNPGNSRTQFVTNEQQQMVFSNDNPAPYVGNVVKSKPGRRVQHWLPQAVWHQVPTQTIMGGSYGIPANMAAATGTVNSGAIFNMQAGTALFMDPEVQPIMAPTSPGTVGATGVVPRLWNCRLQWDWFDPAPRAGQKRGHNLVPIPGSPTGAWGEIVTGITFWPSQFGGVAIPQPGGASLYPSSDHEQIFKPV